MTASGEQLLELTRGMQAARRVYRDHLREFGRDREAEAAKDTRLEELIADIRRLFVAGVLEQMTPTQRLQYMAFHEKYEALYQECLALQEEHASREARQAITALVQMTAASRRLLPHYQERVLISDTEKDTLEDLIFEQTAILRAATSQLPLPWDPDDYERYSELLDEYNSFVFEADRLRLALKG